MALRQISERADHCLDRLLQEKALELASLRERLNRISPEGMLVDRIHALQLLSERADAAMKQSLEKAAVEQEKAGMRLEQAAEKWLRQVQADRDQLAIRLNAVNPSAVLERGYAFVSGPNGRVTTAEEAKRTSTMQLYFKDGSLQVHPADA